VTFIDKDIADHLKGSIAIADAFGPHIYPEVVPQGLKPEQFILINIVSAQPEYALSGEVGTHTTIVQVDVWTDGRGGRTRANELGELVRNRLSGYRGQFGSGAFGTAEQIRLDSVAQTPGDGSGNFPRRVSIDYKVTHAAAVPTLT